MNNDLPNISTIYKANKIARHTMWSSLIVACASLFIALMHELPFMMEINAYAVTGMLLSFVVYKSTK